MQGYLATIMSGEENTFITSKLVGNGWIGAQMERYTSGILNGRQNQ